MEINEQEGPGLTGTSTGHTEDSDYRRIGLPSMSSLYLEHVWWPYGLIWFCNVCPVDRLCPSLTLIARQRCQRTTEEHNDVYEDHHQAP